MKTSFIIVSVLLCAVFLYVQSAASLQLPHKKLSAILQAEMAANGVTGSYDVLVFLNDKINIAEFMSIKDIDLRAQQLVFEVRVWW